MKNNVIHRIDFCAKKWEKQDVLKVPVNFEIILASSAVILASSSLVINQLIKVY